MGDAKVDTGHDRDEYNEFFARHYPRLLSFIRRRVNDTHIAEDICSECFLLAWKALDRECAHSPGWLYAAAKNLIGTEYRRQLREHGLMLKLADIEHFSAPDSETAEIAIALTCLESNERAALTLTYWCGMTASEAAELAGCSERAMWKRISRARSELLGILSADDSPVMVRLPRHNP